MPAQSPVSAAPMRLQKFLSDAGAASRRHAEELILEGRVTVNGRVVDTLPAFVDPAVDRVVVDGTPVRLRQPAYWLVNKPKGVVCTNSDPAGRVRAVDLLPPELSHLFTVGRLDAESTGLLLMTNDGELAERITHPRYGIPKTYRAEVRGRVPAELPATLRKGVYLAEGRARASEVEVLHVSNERSVLRVTLREGKNREVRRILARLGYPVRTLRRIAIGPLTLKGLPLGAARRVSERELRLLERYLAAPPSDHVLSPNRKRGARTEPERRRGTAGAPPRRPGRKPAQPAPRRPAPGAAPGRPRDADHGPTRRIIT